MKPEVICLMLSSVDGRLNPSQWSRSPDGDRGRWSELYEDLHKRSAADAWLVGRVTMAEMTKGAASATGTSAASTPGESVPISRSVHKAPTDVGTYAVTLDPASRLRFSGPTVGGDHVIVLLSSEVGDAHLQALAEAGVSYVVSAERQINLAAALETLRREFGIRRLMLEGGGGANGSLIAAGLVDELHVLLAPALEGKSTSRAIVETGEHNMAGRIEMSLISCECIDAGIVHLRYKLVSPEKT